jgi:hypothetical protein
MRRPTILWKPSRDERLRTLMTRMKLAAARTIPSPA